MKTTGINRRTFIAGTAAAAGSLALTASPLFDSTADLLQPAAPVTVGQIIDEFIKQIPGAPFPGTVDTLKSGSRDMRVTGIITTMFATIPVIRKAIDLGANFIIAHEPTFYNHQDEIAWLEGSDVYQYKAGLLKQHNITVWRNHDDVHSFKPDGVYKGLIEQLGWQKFADLSQRTFELNSAPTLKQLIAHCKKQLNIEMVRYIGHDEQPCKSILLMPGAPGGKRHIEALIRFRPDVLICGELSEWETAEYVRDAVAKGDKLGLIVLGHIASEEPGSKFMAGWIREHFPSLKVTHLPSGNSLSFA